MPLVIPIAFYLILPQPEAFGSVQISASYEEEEVPAEYTTLPTEEEDDGVIMPKLSVALSLEDKWRLVKPLLPKYMLPLCACFIISTYCRPRLDQVPTVLVYTVSPNLKQSSFHGSTVYHHPAGIHYQSGQSCRQSAVQCAHSLQGVAPTLLYPVPSSDRYWLLSKIIHSIRDYYPLWQVRCTSSRP